MHTARLPSRRLQTLSAHRVLYRPCPVVPKSKKYNFFKKSVSLFIFSIVTFGILRPEASDDSAYPEDAILADRPVAMLKVLSDKLEKEIDMEHFAREGPERDFPEPLFNHDRLRDEILSVSPQDIFKNISGNQGEGCNVYVIDRGGINSELSSKWLYHDKSCVANSGEVPDFSHGNEVLSVIIGENGLAKNAKVIYFEISDVFGLPIALLKTAYVAEAPGVVTCSVTATTASNWRMRRAEPLLRLFIDIAVAIITYKGIPVVVAAGNESSIVLPRSDLPVSCQRVWPIGNVKRTRYGSWRRHQSSNYGDWVKYFAVGSNIVVPAYERDQGDYASRGVILIGTSYSAPAAAAVIALLMTAYPWMQKADVEIALDHVSVAETDSEGNKYKRIPVEMIENRDFYIADTPKDDQK